MTIERMDHVGIVVDDLEAATAFFADLGLKLQGERSSPPRHELTAAGSHGGDGGVEVVDCECEMADARGVRRRVPVAAPDRGGVELHQLEPSVALRGLQHRDLRSDALEPDYAVHPTVLDSEDIYRLCYVRGPEGIIVELAEKIG